MKLLLSLALIFALVATITATIGYGLAGPIAYGRYAPGYRGLYGYRVGYPAYGYGARLGRSWAPAGLYWG